MIWLRKEKLFVISLHVWGNGCGWHRAEMLRLQRKCATLDWAKGALCPGKSHVRDAALQGWVGRHGSGEIVFPKLESRVISVLGLFFFGGPMLEKEKWSLPCVDPGME